MAGNTYSFKDVQASIVGPGGAFTIGNGAGSAEEGISVEFTEDADKLTIGADGSGMHSLNASQAGRVVIRLLKTSLTNGLLAAMYNFQHGSAANWGQNTIAVVDAARGDIYSCQQCAFTKFPANKYGKEGNILEWEFNAIVITPLLALT